MAAGVHMHKGGFFGRWEQLTIGALRNNIFLRERYVL